MNCYASKFVRLCLEQLYLIRGQEPSIPSQKELISSLHVYGEGDLSDDLRKKTYDSGWTIGVAQLEIRKEVWICDEGRFDFDNEQDSIEHMTQSSASSSRRKRKGVGARTMIGADAILTRRTIRTTIEQTRRFLGGDVLPCILTIG